MKCFFYFIFFLKADIRINPEILLGKDFNNFGLAIGIGDDIDIGSYTYFKTEAYFKYEFEINNVKLLNKFGCFLELGKRQSIGLKYKINYKFAQIALLIIKEKYKFYLKIEFGLIKFYKDYFCEVSLGFHRNEIDKVKNKDEYIAKVKKAGKEKLKKQILHKFIWNNQIFLERSKIEITTTYKNGYNITTTKEEKKLDSQELLDEYIQTFDPLFENITSIKLNRTLDEIFIKQKELFKEKYHNASNVCPNLNKYSDKFLTQGILDLEYQKEDNEEQVFPKNNYFSVIGVKYNLINRAIKYQKHSKNLFLLKPTIGINKCYEQLLDKILVPELIVPSDGKIGHVFMKQIEGNQVNYVDFFEYDSKHDSNIENCFYINDSDIPIAYGLNCVLYSYFLAVFSLISEDLDQGKKIFLNFYQNFDEFNKEKIKSQIIEFLKNPIKSKNNLEKFLNGLRFSIYYSEEKNKNFVKMLKDIFLKGNL